MTLRRRAVATLPLTVLLCLVGLTPADAETKISRDAARDAPAAIDITRFRATNAEHRIFMTLRVRDLRSAGIQPGLLPVQPAGLAVGLRGWVGRRATGSR